jgi:non-specific serine/threonine protein kinase
MLPAEGADAAAIRDSEAVRLLADRAAAQGAPLAWDEQGVQTTGRICRRLDGIPLALELAAARLRVMSAGELEARLDERFAVLGSGARTALPRHQTLRAMVDWSWDLLTGVERVVLGRLSVFAGGFGLAAVEAVVAGSDVPAGEVVGVLGALVDKSLVQFGDAADGPDRYRLLETVRQYAAGQLAAKGPAAVATARLAHRDYYLAMAEEAAPHLWAAHQPAWLRRLDAELGNLRAAVAVSLTQPDPEPGLRLASALARYWRARGYAAEGGGVLRALLDMPAARAPTLPRARALLAAANLLGNTAGFAIIADYCQEALVIARAAGDEHLVVEVLRQQAWVLFSQGQAAAALQVTDLGLALARRLGYSGLTARMLDTRSMVEYADGDLATAGQNAMEALRLHREGGHQIGIGEVLGNLGTIEMAAGEMAAARRHLTESLAIARELDDRFGIVHEAFNLGLVEYLHGSQASAQILFAETFDRARRAGMKGVTAYALLGLALVGSGGGGEGRSARLHGAADQALDDLGEALEPLEARLAEQDRERLRAALGDEAFDAEYAAGRTLDPAQVLAALGAEGAAAGRAVVSETGAVMTVAGEDVTALTPRELDVLKLVAHGLSNRDIALRLVLSEHTVHRHLANILHKLGLSSRAAAASWGVRAGLV